jgi:hypothetical protein
MIKILGNYYLASQQLGQNAHIEKVDIVIKREGSQINASNVFSESISEVEDFHIKTICGLNQAEEIVINEQEIKWSTLNSRTLIDGFENFTDVLCSIE